MIAVHRIAEHWYIPLIRALIAILFGVIVLVHPVAAVATFVLLFGAFAFADGIVSIVSAFRFAQPSTGRWWWMLAQGVVGILVGLIAFFWPISAAWALSILIAAWAFSTGVLELGAAFRLRRDVPGEIFLAISGVLSILLGIAFVILPGAALLTLVFVVGFYAIVAGVALVVLSIRLRSLMSRTHSTPLGQTAQPPTNPR
ncbi:MAG: HdeD family acid-resistance protein [Vulcanimicrobiaceae bacterium]